MKKISYGVLGVLAILGIFFLLKPKKENNPITYDVITLTKNNGLGYIEVNGNVNVNDTKKVFVDKKLKVKEVFVQAGDYVEKEQLLMTFDEEEKNRVKRNIEKEQLSLNKLRRNYEIEKKLYEIGGTALNNVRDLRDEISKSELNLAEYLEDLQKTATSIKSPVSGTITSLTAQENYLVNTDSPLLEIADLSDIKIILEVPEYDIKNITLGQKLIIKPEVFEKRKEFYGKITKISKISEVSKITGENIVKVEVKPDEVIPYIMPGFKVVAVIYLGNEEKGILVPKSSVLEKNGKYYLCGVDKNGIVKFIYITVSNLEGDNILVTSGINGGEKILSAPNDKIEDGTKINISVEEGKTNNVKNRKFK